MSHRSEAADARASGDGSIDYRLARQVRIAEYRRGELDRKDVCDAQPELRRAATSCGREIDDRCPVCDGGDGHRDDMVLVTYVFGPRLPRFGRCITKPEELTDFERRQESFRCYTVEVCRNCWWNHLRHTVEL